MGLCGPGGPATETGAAPGGPIMGLAPGGGICPGAPGIGGPMGGRMTPDMAEEDAGVTSG